MKGILTLDPEDGYLVHRADTQELLADVPVAAILGLDLFDDRSPRDGDEPGYLDAELAARLIEYRLARRGWEVLALRDVAHLARIVSEPGPVQYHDPAMYTFDILRRPGWGAP